MRKPRVGRISSGSSPAVSSDDVVKTLEMPVLLAAAWALPRPAWSRLVGAYVALRSRCGARRHRRLEATLTQTLTRTTTPGQPEPVARTLEIHRYLHYLEVLRQYRPGSGAPPSELVGSSHLGDALASGRGAILLVGHFVHNGLAPKSALAEAGYAVTHLSRPEHGFSKTRFGIRILNPIRRRVEDRYLHERVLVTGGSRASASRHLVRTLERNGVVSITAGAWEASKLLEPRLLGLRYPLASGAFAMARLTGAALLPVVAVFDSATDAVRVVIEPPVMVEAPNSEDLTEAAQLAVDRFAAYVVADPGQFRGWGYLKV